MLALILLAVTLAWPDVATLAVVFLVFTNAVAVAVAFHGVPYAAGALLPLLLIGPFAAYLFRGEKVILVPTFFPLAVLALAYVLSTMMSREIDHALENLKTFVFEGLVIFFLITNVVRTPQMVRRVARTLLVAGGALAALTVLKEVTGMYEHPYGGFAQVNAEFVHGQTDEIRMSGPLGDPNYYAQILLVLVPIGLVTMWSERRRSIRLGSLAAVAVIGYAILLTLSRGAAAAFVLTVVVMVFLRYVTGRQLLFVVLAVVLVVALVPDYRARVTSLGEIKGAQEISGTDADLSYVSRTNEMLTAGLVFVDHPVTGVGPGVFQTYYQHYADRVGVQSIHKRVKYGADRGASPAREAHNLFLGMAADVGALGLLAFLAVVLVTVTSLVRARAISLRMDPDLASMATAMLLALLAYLAAGLFLTLAFERYFWLLLALASAAAWTARREHALASILPRPRATAPVAAASADT